MVRRTGTRWFVGDDRFIELMHALTHPDTPWSHPEQPSILLVLNELIAWANDARRYDERIHKAGWVSVGKDFSIAVSLLGTSMREALKLHLDAIRNLWHDDIGGDATARTRLANEATTLRQALADTATLKASWQDLRRASSRSESSIKVVSVRRDTFWAVVRAADRNTTELSRRLTGVLSGYPSNTFWAKVELGEVDPSSTDVKFLRGAPLTEPIERLQLVERLLQAEPTSRAHIVWFAFKDAYLQTTGMDLGNLQLFWGEWLRENLTHGEPFRPEVPTELCSLEEPDIIPDKPDVVLARVDLGTGTFSDAVRIAYERLEVLLEVSTLGRPDQWKWLPGYIHFQDGQVASQRYFDYGDNADGPRHLRNNATAQIDYMAPRIAPMIPIQDKKMRDIIGALRWWRVGLDHPTAAAIVLNVRVIELVASRVGETSWTTYLEKYFKNWWIHRTIKNSIHYALHEALHGRVYGEADKRKREIFLETVTRTNGQQGMDVPKAATFLDEIIDFVPGVLPLARDLRSIKQRTSNVDAVEAWCTELERVWNSQVHRLERIRNAVGHGGPFTETAVLLTQPFSRQVSVHALRETIDGFLHGKTLEQTHLDFARGWDDWRTSVRTATAITDVLIED